jgi:hypothetical protein
MESMETIDEIRIKELIIKHLKVTLTDDEQLELNQVVAKQTQLKFFLQNIRKEEFIREKYGLYKQFDSTKDWKNILRNLQRKSKPRRIGLYIARIAATLLIPLVVGSLLVMTDQINTLRNLFIETEISIEPGKPEAILILSSGEKLLLDYTKDTLLMEAGSIVKINRSNGISYLKEKSSTNILLGKQAYQIKELPLNTLKIERGREFFLVLSDGSKVWLNSETELKFPVCFMGSKREIYLKGEAYFEVAENKEKPFIVHTKDMDVKVTGTSFNMMAYEDEEDVRTTLVEGQVIVSNPNVEGRKIILNFNQQAIIDIDGIRVKEVNSDLVANWRNNSFGFEYERLTTVVNKISRWYDVEFIYADESIKSNHFSGKIPKYENISTALELLELTTNIHFKLKENKIIIEKEDI